MRQHISLSALARTFAQKTSFLYGNLGHIGLESLVGEPLEGSLVHFFLVYRLFVLGEPLYSLDGGVHSREQAESHVQKNQQSHRCRSQAYGLHYVGHLHSGDEQYDEAYQSHIDGG